jgi:radical SAM family protein
MKGIIIDEFSPFVWRCYMKGHRSEPAGVADAPPRLADLHVVFPPQWSPFQPFLSTPSLKAYLEMRGHCVVQSDWNVGFYDYFISADRVPLARRRLLRYVEELGDCHAAYRARAVHALAVLKDWRALRRTVDQLRDPTIVTDLARFKQSVDAFQRLLDAFSVAEPVVEMGTSSLSTGDILSNFEGLTTFIANDTENPFIPYFRSRIREVQRPRYFGISIIGVEQLVSGLTLCNLLKQTFPDTPVIIGGSVFSRLVEKDDQMVAYFRRYFDFVCRFEGEQPMDAFLSSSDPRRARTPNLAFLEDDQLVLTPLCEPLGMQAIPTPDFEGLPFEEYLTPEIVLPLLTTRGCYWGKCAFCYHGMIYQDRYRMRDPELIAQDVAQLNRIHGARHFAFNDEALPPKIFRLLPGVVPGGRYFFTALYKFEKYFKPEDYQAMYRAGFRSCYIGLETASERVQAHMMKNNLQSTMIANLQDAHNAGIWNHTFVFFGFPTETEAEAEETIDFMLSHVDIIHSEGTGTFSFEHNAPIHGDPVKFGVSEVTEKPNRILELYYDYKPTTGIDAAQAQAMLDRFNDLKRIKGLYQTGRWIPREFLLILLSHHRRDDLKQALIALETPEPLTTLGETLAWLSAGSSQPDCQRHFVVNKTSRQVFETNEDTVALLSILDERTSVSELVRTYPVLEQMI